MENLFNLIRAGICLMGALVLAGCLSSTPHWDATFGDSLTQLRQMQRLNPNASSNNDPVLGIDGGAGDAGQKSYMKSFTSPSSGGNSLTIGVGSSNSGY